MKEFAQKGFKNASTDNIVKEADISKGALFYYFKNKKELYFFLNDYALDILKNEIMMKFDYSEKDLFARRRQGMLLKTEVLKKHPELYDFLGNVYMEDSLEVKPGLDSRFNGVIAEGQAKVFEGIDTSKFKEGIDVEKAIEIINWTIEGLSNKQMQVLKNIPMEEVNFNALLSEVDSYMDMLKKCFYN